MDQQLQTDLVIGAVTNYDWNKIKYWANSLVNCGFTGDKTIIVYNCDYDTISKLTDCGFNIISFYQDQITKSAVWPHHLTIVVDRFYHMWQYLNQLPKNKYRYVITTDVKDVIFQKNPSDFLENHLGSYDILASCESLKYQDEPWGCDNLQGSFPYMAKNLLDKPIWNCGVQAGKMSAIGDLWFQIWSLSKIASRPNGDQAAYNILMNSIPWQRITKFTMSEDGWACQAGTTVDPEKIKNFRPHLLEKEPVWNDQFCTTSYGKIHTIVHQWDRIPDWKNIIEEKYG